MTDDPFNESAPLDHREQAMAYYGNALNPDERSAFEAHLATCAECQALLTQARLRLPAAEALLAADGLASRPISEAVKDFDRQVRLRRPGATVQSRPWAWGGLVALALAAVAVGLELHAVNSGPVYAPSRDAGVPADGGRPSDAGGPSYP